MPGTAVDVGHGTTITFGTSGFTANIMSVRWSGIQRTAVETSHMATTAPGANQFGNKTFIPSDLSDPGELTLELHFNPQTNPPIDAVAETMTVTWPLVAGDSTPASWACSGFVTGFDLTDPLEDKMTSTCTIKLSGKVSMTDAA
jgi:hypothetical protein